MAPRPTIALALYAALTAVACGSRAAPGSSPRATLEALSSAARSHDAAALYALLPARARQAESLEAFRARIAADRTELGQLGAEVTQALASPRAPQVQVPLADGEQVTARQETDGWRMGHPGFVPTVSPEPEDAVRALRDALARRSLGAVLAALSSRARGSLEAEISALLEATSDPAGLEIVRTSQRATVHLTGGRQLELVFDGNAWRVDELR